MRILVVEDEASIARDIERALGAAGFAVECVGDGDEALFRGETEEYAAIILDLGLPNLDGATILKRWRSSGRAMPIVVLTARGSWTERVAGIDAGADDYISKPFEMDELIARLRAVLRRTHGQASSVLTSGNVSLNTRRMQCTVDDQPVSLSPLEFRLLSYLMHHTGRVVTQAELTEQLYAQDFERDSNSIEVLVGRLRRKLKSDIVTTRRGLGYYVADNIPD